MKKKAKRRRAKKRKAAAAAAAPNTGEIRMDKAAWALERETEAEESESRTNWNAYEAHQYRDFWNSVYARTHGSFEDTTSISPMRYADDVCDSAAPQDILQIFSVKVVGIKEGLHWPLEVYGLMALRDTVDHNRNIIFDRSRD